jgi:hypothetical protein
VPARHATHTRRGTSAATKHRRHTPPPHAAAATTWRRHADVDFSSHPAKYIRYAAADVASIIDDDLFETKALPAGGRLSLQREKLGAIV